jgi:outer membrane protein, heavy metal efflux system
MRRLLCAWILTALSGCHAYYLDVDGQIAARASRAIDVQPQAEEKLPTPPKKLPDLSPVPMEQTRDRPKIGAPGPQAEIVLTQAKKEGQPAEKDAKYADKLKFSPDILGFEIPDLKLPAHTLPPKDREIAIRKQFPPLPALPKLPEALPGPDGTALTLTELQQLALRTNPVIRQAHLEVEAARGVAKQAGLYPNPVIGYESSANGQGNQDGKRTPGQQGGFAEQTIVTMGKLTLARAAALRDVQIAEQHLKKAEADLQAQVRSGYFAVLSARENFRVTKGLTELTDKLSDVMLLQLVVGQVAGYEPAQIRVLALTSRNTLTLAHNRYVSAWKQLAAHLGTPKMPLTALAGQIDMPVPHFEHDQVLEVVLDHHTEIVAAQLRVERQRIALRLAEVMPFPDITVHAAFQKDFTTPPFGTVASVNVGMPFPLWNRNQGNIQAASALLRKALEDDQRVRNELTGKVAEAFERYENNRVLLDTYKKQILPNQVQAFRAAVLRHALGGDDKISYTDVVTSQQTLVGLINSYLTALNDQWSAVVDIANLLQTDDLFQMRPVDEVAPVPDVYEIFRGGWRNRR